MESGEIPTTSTRAAYSHNDSLLERLEGKMSAPAGSNPSGTPFRLTADRRSGREKMSLAYLVSNATDLSVEKAVNRSLVVSGVDGSRGHESRTKTMSVSFSLQASTAGNPGAKMPAVDGQASESQSSHFAGDGRFPVSSSRSPDSSDNSQDWSMRQPRAPRPTYTEEQKFFIMYSRIIRTRSWPDIEDDFTKTFPLSAGQRSKGGLTSVYYRIRRSWYDIDGCTLDVRHVLTLVLVAL